MVFNKSLDNVEVIAALLHDVHSSHEVVFNSRALKLTVLKVRSRVRSEGQSFLTKTLPSLGKAFDKALNDVIPLNSAKLKFKSQPNSELPLFLGEFFNRVLDPNGRILPNPCASSVQVIRRVCGLFYKLELPYTTKQEQQVVDSFVKAEDDISACKCNLQSLAITLNAMATDDVTTVVSSQCAVARRARKLLARVFQHFDPTDIVPRHGPGAVATRQKLWDKFHWTNVSDRITELYPFDAYFMASLGHVCDDYKTITSLSSTSLPARVLLVPKDSRGPRLISCEPVDFQWVQQGLSKAIVELVESHKLTKFAVHFTDQVPNRCGAILGSIEGRYATLDLKEASDRVSLDLVHLLFPENLCRYLDACRSLSTVLPNGQELTLQKFAPMGSSLCFPIMALTIWAILHAAAPDAYTRERILVYGDDVIVPTAYAANAIEQLESFGLLVNRDKSCISGLFRESCGADAFKGVNVTPVRIRTGWSSSPSPDAYPSWVAYANSFYDMQYYNTYDLIVERLLAVYGKIPDESMQLACISLRVTPEHARPTTRRSNPDFQKSEYLVWDLRSPRIKHVMKGWSMLLRHFTESTARTSFHLRETHHVDTMQFIREMHAKEALERESPVFTVGSYTSRRTSVLVRRWR